MTDDLYYRKMESTLTTDLVDMIRERDRHIEKLEAEIQNLEGIKLAQETALSTEYMIEEQLQYELKNFMTNKINVAKELIQSLSTCLESHHTNSYEHELIQKANKFLEEK